MRREEKITIAEFNFSAVASDKTVDASGVTAESGKRAHSVWMRQSMVSGLIGSLLLVLAMLAAPAKSSASVGIFVSFGPPAIPVYVQPPCPAVGYIWTPGYWAWDPDYGYFWVPGTWVVAPFVGALWTPGYWGWYNSGYIWYPGYWGPEVGFYGGIDYGYGYPGRGYYGGQWRGDRFFYNREVTHITNVNIVNVYNERVVVNQNGPRISYNGGRGGIDARPTTAEISAERSRRSGAVNQQVDQERFARNDPGQRARENRGRPAVAATSRPGEFQGQGAVRANRAGAPYKEPPRQVNNGQVGRRSQPAPVERGPAVNSPSPAPANPRMENRAPAQPQNGPSINRNDRPPEAQPSPRESQPPQARPNEGGAYPQPRNERPMNRNDRTPQVQRDRNESRAPQARPNEGRGAQERQSNPNEGRRGGGNDNNNHPPRIRR